MMPPQVSDLWAGNAAGATNSGLFSLNDLWYRRSDLRMLLSSYVK